MKRLGYKPGLLFAGGGALLCIQVTHLALYYIQLAEELQRLGRRSTLGAGMQFEELAPSMGRSAHLHDALCEAGLAAGVVVADTMLTSQRASIKTGWPGRIR